MPRTVAVVTSSRADYGHLYWVLREMREHRDLEPRIVVMGAHLSEEFGTAVGEIERDGFAVAERVECLIDSDTDVGMASTIGVATLGLAQALGRMRPDMLLLIADRYEMLAPASVGLALRVPMAHIEGGDVSEGAIDDAVRNALTKMAHLHFAPTETARRRLLSMGEEEWRVHRSGAPSLDHLRRSRLLDRRELESRLGCEVAGDSLLVSYHPVTIARDTLLEADALFAALERTDRPLVFCFPNADAGSRALGRRARALCERRERARMFVNLNPVVYWSLLRAVGAMVGNSSSGIMESPSVRLPAVDVGMRQQGRERAPNVIGAPAEAKAIAAAIDRAFDPAFRERLGAVDNPYGDGHAAERIVEALASAPAADRLLRKRPASV